MSMTKKIASLLIYSYTFLIPFIFSCCNHSDSDSCKLVIPKGFSPDIYITKPVPQDMETKKVMQPLFFEIDHTANPKMDVYLKAVRQFGGQEVMLLTDDLMRISALYFKRPNAKINLIYVPGFFFDQTPTKEWCAPFAALFPEFNILSIDWRGAGSSEGITGFLRKNSFGTNAYPDIQAAIEFMKRENNNPTILIGFCFGAAMNMISTIQAQQEGRPTADALVINCIFSAFENQYNRAVKAEDRCLYRMLMNLGIGRWLVEYQANGDLFEVKPRELIKAIKIPCYFEHFSYDPFAILPEGIEVFQAATCPKMFAQFDVGRHVRMHTKVPYQYREAFLTFLRKFGFLPAEQQQVITTPAPVVPAITIPVPAVPTVA